MRRANSVLFTVFLTFACNQQAEAPPAAGNIQQVIKRPNKAAKQEIIGEMNVSPDKIIGEMNVSPDAVRRPPSRPLPQPLRAK